jgi:hypothetical protein
MMKKIVFAVCVWLLSLSAMLCIPAAGSAGLPVPPPPLVIPAPPPVFVIPGTYAYFAPDVDVELFFYHGFWYRHHAEYWYRSSHYGGPWGFVVMSKVPRVLINLPPGYRNVPPGHKRIPYNQLRKNWKPWEREKHWDRPGKQKNKEKREHEQTEHGFGKGHGKGHGR